MDLRKAAKSLPTELDTAAHWIESCPFENAIPHAERLRKRSEEIRVALAQPDMLAEAVELLREVPTQTTGFMPISSSMAIRDFLLRYDEQQERTDA